MHNKLSSYCGWMLKEPISVKMHNNLNSEAHLSNCQNKKKNKFKQGTLMFLYPVQSLILPFAAFTFVYECVCVRDIVLWGRKQADSHPCWQENTAGRLITARTRQALTGASSLLTSQWHQMLCVYLHVRVLAHMHVCTLVCVCQNSFSIYYHKSKKKNRRSKCIHKYMKKWIK